MLVEDNGIYLEYKVPKMNKFMQILDEMGVDYYIEKHKHGYFDIMIHSQYNQYLAFPFYSDGDYMGWSKPEIKTRVNDVR